VIHDMDVEIGDVYCTVCDEKVRLGSKDGSMIAYCGCDVVLKVANMESPYAIERWE